MTYKPLQGPAEGIYWYVLQNFSAAEVVFNRFWRQLQKASSKLLDGKPHESERRVSLVKGINIFFKSGANEEDLRGETLNGAILDEMRQQKKTTWPMIVRPMLSRYKGWADLYSTPNGYDHFYDIAEEARQDESGEWGLFHAPSTEAWWWTPEEIASAKRTMSEAEFAQEIMAEFRDLTAGKAYVSFGTPNIVQANPFMQVYTPEPHPAIPIVVAMDFNITPMAWTLGQQRNEDFYWFSEIWMKNSNTQEAAKELIERVRGHKPGVVLVGDATGKARQRAAAGKSDYDIVKAALFEAGIPYVDRTPESNPTVKDRVNAMNAKMRAADGAVHFYCLQQGVPQLIRDCQRVVWKLGAEATLDQTSDRERTHASDGPGYAVCALSPLKGPGNVGAMRIINRG